MLRLNTKPAWDNAIFYFFHSVSLIGVQEEQLQRAKGENNNNLNSVKTIVSDKTNSMRHYVNHGLAVENSWNSTIIKLWRYKTL